MTKFLKSFLFAFKGLTYAFKTQLNFKVNCIAACLVIGLGYYCEINRIEWLWLCLCIALVFILELLNTAIEVLVDLVSPTYNAKAGTVKDLSAAAVLISAIFTLLVAVIIFYPKLYC